MPCTATHHFEYDVFLSFRGLDTRRSFISFLYKQLIRNNIRTFRDDKELESGCRISPELVRAIQNSRFAVVVVSEDYPASTWCLDELVTIMDFANRGSITVMPVFYGVDPSHLRWQIGLVSDQFEKHEAREDHEKVLLWRHALSNLASISGDCSVKWEDDSKMVDEITERISNALVVTNTPRSNGSDLVDIDVHMKALCRLMNLNSNKSVRVIGIWARGGTGRSALARFLYRKIRPHFESHCFLENVKRISQDRHISHLHERIQGECLTQSRGSRLKYQKVLLVADDVNTIEQLDALAEDFNCFGPGSVVIITTQDKMLLKSFGIELVYEIELLRFQVREFLRQIAFRERDISAEFESVLVRAMNLAVEWLGCQLGRTG